MIYKNIGNTIIEGYVNLDGKYKDITLCGNAHFKDVFIEIQASYAGGQYRFDLGLFGHSKDENFWTECTKEMLDYMYRRKIDIEDEIFVINVVGYIGSGALGEIEYAMKVPKVRSKRSVKVPL